MRKHWGAAAVMLAVTAAVLGGCAAPTNAEPCKDFIQQANTSIDFAFDEAESGEITTARALMEGLPDVLAGQSEKATGAPQEAMSIFIVSLTLFNSGGEVDLGKRLDSVRDACTKDGVSF